MKRPTSAAGGRLSGYSLWLWDAAPAHPFREQVSESRSSDFPHPLRLPPQPTTLSASSTRSRE